MERTRTEVQRSANGRKEVSERERYRILTDERRRAALRELDGRAAPVSLDELAAAVEERTDGERNRVAVSLHHAHLPMLDDAGLVDYDADGNRITAIRIPDGALH